jgi:hypothetical protein
MVVLQVGPTCVAILARWVQYRVEKGTWQPHDLDTIQFGGYWCTGIIRSTRTVYHSQTVYRASAHSIAYDFLQQWLNPENCDRQYFFRHQADADESGPSRRNVLSRASQRTWGMSSLVRFLKKLVCLAYLWMMGWLVDQDQLSEAISVSHWVSDLADLT